MFEYAVVGSGLGGSAIAAYLQKQGKSVVLFEKEPYLGGCSSSFVRHGFTYNTGATTFAGYEDGMMVKELFDRLEYQPELIKTDPSIVVLHNGKTTHRYQNKERFLKEIEHNYPHEKHQEFWNLVYAINKNFYKESGYYYSNKSFFKKVVSLLSFTPLLAKYGIYFFRHADRAIEAFYGAISESYKEFLEAQVLIVTQAPLKEINFFTAALALAYTFNDNYYVKGGFSKLFDGMTKDVEHLHTKSAVVKIRKYHGMYELQTKKGLFLAKNVVLNTTIYDSANFFEDEQIKAYYAKHEKRNNYQSSFMLYATIKTDKKLHHHYQLIQNRTLKMTLSNAIFVSFSDQSDTDMVPQGYYSMSASIHTDVRFWSKDKEEYARQKEALQAILVESIKSALELEDEIFVSLFSATPHTFARYIGRSQLGGSAMSIKNFLPLLPSNDTPIDGLYHVGDSVYAAQGWPGVIFGVKNLTKLLDV